MSRLHLPSRYQLKMWLLSLGMIAGALCVIAGLIWGLLVLWWQVSSPGSPTSVTTEASSITTPAAPANHPAGTDLSLAIDDPDIEQAILAAINADRRANGLTPVAWDTTAAAAGAAHAADMAALGYFSHWSPDGHGPEMRYSRAGGTDNVMENIFTSVRLSNGYPALIDDFTELALQAESSLIQSPGHRRNILTPSHTHVGVGFAYNPRTGSFYVAQEFVDRYVEMQPLAQTGQVGEQITVRGQLLPGAAAPLVNATYAPFPRAMSLDELNATGTYQRDAEIYAPLTPQIAGDGSFRATLPLDYAGRTGIYSIRVWVQVGGEQVLASEQLIEIHA